jgi:hypothetical protein
MITLMMLVGILAVATGLLWAAQGAGVFPYPSSSFMIGDMMWFYYGMVTAVSGVAVIMMARRRGRRERANKGR